MIIRKNAYIMQVSIPICVFCNANDIFQVGLTGADQILEYNGVDLRQSTAEQAAYELAKPAEKVTILVQYNLESKWFFDTFLASDS